MGVAVGGLLLLTNARELSSAGDLGSARWLAYGLVATLIALAALRPRLGAASPAAAPVGT
jgi:hypothetical protein